ncbi:MAG: bifunctional phosphopantothenoylcysteine decarboxylase/phosphopantothenate--cysteine ligase CoaBC [Acidobacteriota bacterium]|nr:bifunctional phosphopantothenoylcysteine decarboxylase/phosphopantothenate--cysteine ligase CoaBC [Blastocatellia bacterium]MDW8412401.1 bifunctional phosphopantothenoylcysteine decarboxylase/phosphopantothenate--cysteine ligase CoaBC [Acidobacteriota bacterium]
MRVALGVTGCIGAYKAAEVLRRLQDLSIEVEVVMTRHARQFVQPLTFQALSGNRVLTDENEAETTEILHIALAQRINLLLVAPCTANMMAKFAHGIADDLLSTLYISTPAPVMLAPAMNVHMWQHPATQANIELLKRRGVEFVEPAEGYLACGMQGQGRLAEPEVIARRAAEILGQYQKQDFVGESVLVTAGPTREYLDPIRFITNRSSGKMGYALAEAAHKRGAKVILITGPTALPRPQGVEVVAVTSASEMYEAVLSRLDNTSILIKTAAVCDYRPKVIAGQKIKKDKVLSLELEATPDILAAVSKVKKPGQVIVGFAAETENLLENALTKFKKKQLDLIIANDVSATDAGFDVDTNRVSIISEDGILELPLMTKRELAQRILDLVAEKRQRFTKQQTSKSV